MRGEKSKTEAVMEKILTVIFAAATTVAGVMAFLYTNFVSQNAYTSDQASVSDQIHELSGYVQRVEALVNANRVEQKTDLQRLDGKLDKIILLEKGVINE